MAHFFEKDCLYMIGLILIVKLASLRSIYNISTLVLKGLLNAIRVTRLGNLLDFVATF